MDFLCLIVWIFAVLSILIAATVRTPDHSAWKRIDIAYYTLALLGVILFFLSDTRARTIARSLDDVQIHSGQLENLKRYPPAFQFPVSQDPQIAEGAFDLLAIRALGEECRAETSSAEVCSAARERGFEIDAAFGVLKEPPILPNPVEALNYAENFCNGVHSLAVNVSGKRPGSLRYRRLLQNALAQLAVNPHPDLHRLTQMRREIWLQGRIESSAQAEADFAITVLNAAAACPPDIPPAEIARTQERWWKPEFERHTEALRKANLTLTEVRRVDADEFGGSIGISLAALVRGLWPFFVSTALCLKLAKALRDFRREA